MKCDMVGIVFSNANDELVRELTERRCLGSVPFGGRYRMIDFALSNMVNAGISRVGIITKSNYHSLLDHLGSGKQWDLARKKDGIVLFPPYISYGSGMRSNRVEELASVLRFLQDSKERYVFCCDCDVVCNVDLDDMMEYHLSHQADVTVAYYHGQAPRSQTDRMIFHIGAQGEVEELLLSVQEEKSVDYSLNLFIVDKERMIRAITDAMSRNYTSIARDIFQRNLGKFRMFAYPVGGFVRNIDSMKHYFQANMALLNTDVRNELFVKGRPIYTKVRDEMPAKYGLGASVRNCLISNGCVIEGEVENCILFRGVRIGRGAKLHNCIIMQGGTIGAHAELAYVTTDKDVTILDQRTLIGFETYPAFVAKGVTV